MTQTTLLPPITAVRMVWARTGTFSDDVHSHLSATLTEVALKEIRELADQDVNERKYVISAIATMDANLRNLDIIYKGRELNFKENEKLRLAYLDSVKENLDFGKKAGDFLKSLPAMTIGGAGGVTVAQYFGMSGIELWGVGLALAGISYLINLTIVRLMRKRIQMLYVLQDLDRGIYYDQYVGRVSTTLTSLYLDLDRIHKNVFGQAYPVDMPVSSIVEDMLKGIRPTFCKYVHKHKEENKITPELWTICETGKADATEKCTNWEG